MKTKVAGFLLCLTLCVISLAQKSPSSEESVIQFVKSYDDAWNHKDAVVIQHILAPDYVYFTSKGNVESRQALVNELLSPSYRLASAQRSEVKVYLTAGTAVVSSRWKGEGSYDGKEFHDDQRCSIVLAQETQGWQVLSEHCTQIADR
jgi:ketosteroid isomerase-like protein